MKDVIIIGAGVTGCFVADALATYECSIEVIEKADDVACGSSKANSGIVHGGFDAKPNTLKAKFNIAGNRMFDRLSEELDFPFKRNGAYVLAFSQNDLSALEDLKSRGEVNGVKDLQIVDGDSLRKILPCVSKEVFAALYCPSSGIVSPYEMTLAVAERAFLRGVQFTLNACVTSIEKKEGYFTVRLCDGSTRDAKIVINCAGVHSDEVADLAGAGGFKIKGRKGEYYLLDKTQEYLTSATLFQLPTALGKGVLVTPTVHGNILIGPSALDIDNKDDVSTTVEGLALIMEKGELSVPDISTKYAITQFSGIRAHCDKDDFIIGMSDVVGFYNVAGIESPGLTSAPAIGEYVADEIASYLGLTKKSDFPIIRKGIPHFAQMTPEEKAELIASDSRYGNIVCRCECVTEGEIVNSITRPLGARSMDGVKRRTRAGMGRCQAGFCSPSVIKIIARTLGVPISTITKSGRGSYTVSGKIK